MSELRHSVGFIYVLTNDSIPGTVKIGRTGWLPEDRATDLWTTGVPAPFKVACRMVSSRDRAVEHKAHELLNEFRPNKKREFFTVSVEEAIESVRLAAVEVAGIASWKAAQPYRLRAGDRLALTLESGQCFALLAYKNIFGSAEILDIWQAHSDGDSLEIFCTDEPRYVAGFSNMDPKGAEDPVPYLDRTCSVANGMLNGRERLMPGDRLVWLSEPDSSESLASVVFEAVDHCQVASRTWSPCLNSLGCPLTLNDFTHDEMSPEAVSVVRQVLKLPMPRTWAPRDNRGDSWVPLGTIPAQAEHWLPQLAPRRMRRSGA